MADIEKQVKQNFTVLNKKLEYLSRVYNDPDTKYGVKYQIKTEIKAIEFIMEYAREALLHRGIIA